MNLYDAIVLFYDVIRMMVSEPIIGYPLMFVLTILFIEQFAGRRQFATVRNHRG